MQKKYGFDQNDTIDILYCKGWDHGYPFSTNFNPRINLREVSSPGAYYENGKWITIPAMSSKGEYEFDGVGKKDIYILHKDYSLEKLTSFSYDDF